MPKILEIACFNLESALCAQAGGADRIELCENYKEGGITPSHQLILEARQKIQIPIHVIIRPRGGNFIYRESELNQMRESILFCKGNNINGIVFGVLTIHSEINETICAELIALAKPMTVTFHRAVDLSHDLASELKKLIAIKCDKVLSSGGKNSALEGISILKKLQTEFENKITIMPGGGIRSSNLKQIMDLSACNEFHSAAIIDTSETASEQEIKALKMILDK